MILAIASAACAPSASNNGLPVYPDATRTPDLVELKTLDPAFHFDIRYATTNNFVGRAVYPEPRAFLQRPAAEALVRVNHRLQPHGYGLLIYDGYRPWSVTKIFWDSVSGEKRNFVADPQLGSRHNRGCAVDLALYHLASGEAAAMPTDYDEMTTRSFPDYTGGSAETRARRDLLRGAMEAEGFTVHPREWWHYDYKDWADYPVIDEPFSALGQRAAHD